MGNIFSRRNIIGTIIITVLVIMCTTITALGLFGQCINNYNKFMLIYDDAELIESTASIANYFGLGDLTTVWFVAEDAAIVQQWYAEILANQRRATREAERAGEKPAPSWNAEVQVESVENGAKIHIKATCY